jgi:hypothetical protein
LKLFRNSFDPCRKRVRGFRTSFKPHKKKVRGFYVSFDLCRGGARRRKKRGFVRSWQRPCNSSETHNKRVSRSSIGFVGLSNSFDLCRKRVRAFSNSFELCRMRVSVSSNFTEGKKKYLVGNSQELDNSFDLCGKRVRGFRTSFKPHRKKARGFNISFNLCRGKARRSKKIDFVRSWQRPGNSSDTHNKRVSRSSTSFVGLRNSFDLWKRVGKMMRRSS